MAEPLAWITGAGGLIGSALVQTASQWAPGWRVRGLTRADVDLLDFTALRRRFETERPQRVVHCAALSQTPVCENNPGLARKLNVEITAGLAGLAKQASFIFFSSDLVFDGRKGNYDESAQVNPLNVYARTKVEAEQIVLANPRHTVIRTSLNGGTSPTGDRGFNEQLRLAFQAGRTLTLFTDEFRSPIAAIQTARAVWELAKHDAAGLYHVAGAERLSRWEIGRLIASRWPQLHPRIEAASLSAYQGPPRAPDTSLNCAKAQRFLSFALPKFSEWLDAHVDMAF